MLLSLSRIRSCRVIHSFNFNILACCTTRQRVQSFSTDSDGRERDVFIFGEPSEVQQSVEGCSGSTVFAYQTFTDLGVARQLAIALQKTEKNIPTIIQKTSFKSIADKKDVVLCAETGSGKTLAYLLPVLEQYYSTNMDRGSVFERGYKYPSTVVIVPNKDLMLQVYHMTQEILQHANTVRTTVEGSSSVQVTCGCVERVDGYWPYSGVADEPSTHCPDILICTPAFPGSFIKGPKISEEDFFYSIKRCILDEADMLLEGSYKKDMERVFDAFKILRRRLMKQYDMKPHERMVQFILSAATISTHGKLSVDQYLKKRFPRAERIVSGAFHMHHPRIEQDFLHVSLLEAHSSGMTHRVHTADYEDSEGNLVTTKRPVTSPARVDMVFRAIIGALPPRETESESEGVAVEEWHRDQWKDEPIDVTAILPTMIFVNTAGKARDLAAALMQHEGGVLAGVVGQFHKLVPTYEKHEALEHFRNHMMSGMKVLVCTDAAARGLDLPEVEHVVQAEFALNVVQHMHRNGRASRAGRRGRATIIFDDSSADLVHSVLTPPGEDCGTGRDGGGRGIEQSFSRRRGFRRNINRKARRAYDRGQSHSGTISIH